MKSEIADDYRAFRQALGAVWLAKEFIKVSGPDAVSYLQGQLSQDISAMDVGTSASTFLLQPQGKVDALLRVTRLADSELLLDVDAGYGQLVVDRLARFKLRIKADIEVIDWKCLALRGPEAPRHPGEGPGSRIKFGMTSGGPPREGSRHPGEGRDPARLDEQEPLGNDIEVDASTPTLPGVDLIGPDVTIPDGAPVCAQEAYDAIRIEEGLPKMGLEIDERTIPQETGLVADTVSFTKGCYTGQELVARIDSRGHVNRHLRGLAIEGDERPATGADIRLQAGDDKVVGTVTSVAWSPHFGQWVALAYVRREVEPPMKGVVMWGEHAAVARIGALPLLS